MKRLATLVLLFATPAVAQQVGDPAVAALQIGNAVGSMGVELKQARETIPALQKQNADLQAQLTAANAKIKELEPKPDAKKE